MGSAPWLRPFEWLVAILTPVRAKRADGGLGLRPSEPNAVAALIARGHQPACKSKLRRAEGENKEKKQKTGASPHRFSEAP